MRILFVLEYFWPQVGGVETLFLELAQGLVQRGHQVTVLTTRLQNTPAQEHHQGIEIRRIGDPARPSRYAFTAAATPSALRLARQADLIHTTTYNAALPAWLAGRLAGKPVTITFHELIGASWHALPGVSWASGWMFRLLELGCMKLPFVQYVGVSRATRNALRQAGVRDHQLTTVYNGVTLEDWASDPEVVARLRRGLRPEGIPLVTFYGRPGVTKGVEVLIEGFRRLLLERPEARLLLILGQYPPERRAMLVRLATETLGASVQIMNSVPRRELPNYLAASDCVAVPSLTEGFGFTAVEAAMLGVPVVASDAGSLPEVLSGEFVLVPPNDPAAFAAGLLRALRGQTTRSPLRRFSADEMVSGYEKVFRDALPGPVFRETKPTGLPLEGRSG